MACYSWRSRGCFEKGYLHSCLHRNITGCAAAFFAVRQAWQRDLSGRAKARKIKERGSPEIGKAKKAEPKERKSKKDWVKKEEKRCCAKNAGIN